MIKYIVKKGETLESIAEDFGITVPELRYYHNDVCELKNLIGDRVKAGTELLLEKGKPSKEKLQEIQQEKEEKQEEKKIQETQEERESHEGSHFLVHGAQCICNKGTTPATLKVTSHTHLVLNDKTQDKYAGTEEDLHFEEGNSCFGSCKLRKNDPCTYSPAGKWKKPYKYTKVFDMSILTELSYLNCTIGGKISVDYHGQKIKIGFMNLQRADSELLNQVMPGLELQEYIEKQDIILEGETEKREEVEALSDKAPQILKAVLLDNTGNLLDRVLSYGESFILRILTHNMRGKSLNFSIYDVVNEKEIEVESNSKPLKVEQDNGIVKSDLIHLNIGMPMKTRQDMGAETHQYRLKIFNEDRTLVEEARFNVKNQSVNASYIPPDIQVPVKVGKSSKEGKEEKEGEETTKEAYIIILSGESHPKWGYVIESLKYEDGTLYEQTGYEEYSTKPYTGKLPSHMQKAKDDLDTLALNSEGKKLMDFFQKGKHRTTVYIPSKDDKEKAKENNERPKNNSGFSGVVYQGEPMELPTEGERFGVSVPSYIILAHELGHAQSFRMGVQNHSYWYNDVMIEEIWGTHVENKVRAAAGIKLRDTYELDKLNTKTQMIDSNGNSLYINKNENYPQNPPQKISTENAFNYNLIKK